MRILRWFGAARTARPAVPDVAAIEKRIQVLLESTRRERDRAAARMDGIQTRATVLIGAAGILGGIQGGRTDTSTWGIVGIVLSVLAAVAGLALLWPLKVLGITNQEFFATMLDYHPVDLQEAILRNELTAARHTKTRLKVRSWTLIVGFTLLAGAWGTSLLALTDASVNPPTDPPIRVEIVE